MSINNDIFTFASFDSNSPIPNEIFDDLLQEKITGIILRDFLSNNEVSAILNGIRHLPSDEKTVINEGFVSYPMSFAQFTQLLNSGQMSVQDYIMLSKKVMADIEPYFGFDFIKKLIDFLEHFQSFKHVSPIYNQEYGESLIPFNIRELLPGNGELIAHCENLFFSEFPEFFNWLRVMNIKDNKLSYFITLQSAEEGGELCCFDLNWKNVKHRESPSILKDINNQFIEINNTETVKRQLIKPMAGDLLLFAGGNVWHRVEKVLGNKSRITLGGFIAETYQSGEYYIWS